MAAVKRTRKKREPSPDSRLAVRRAELFEVAVKRIFGLRALFEPVEIPAHAVRYRAQELLRDFRFEIVVYVDLGRRRSLDPMCVLRRVLRVYGARLQRKVRKKEVYYLLDVSGADIPDRWYEKFRWAFEHSRKFGY